MKKIKGYICGTDWTDELTVMEANDIIIYPSIKSIKDNKKCLRECGIVELELKYKKLIKVRKGKV